MTSPPKNRRRQAALALAVTWIAGCVDAVGYVLLYHIFTANMSGNAIRLGMALAQGDWREVLRRFYPLAAFMLGLLVGGAFPDFPRARRAKSLRLSLALEWLCLLALLLFGHAWWPTVRPLHLKPSTTQFYTLAAFAGIAMGLQNAAVRSAGALSIYTTHVTGTMTHLAHELVSPLRRRLQKRPASHNTGWRVRALAGLCLAYLAGALTATAGLGRFGIIILILPLLVLTAAVLLAPRAFV